MQTEKLNSGREDRGPGSIVQPGDTLPQERRTSERMRTVYRAALLTAGQDSGLCRIRNISDRGMMIITSIEIEKGAMVRLALSDTTSLPGRIMWVETPRVGVYFDHAIDSAGLLQALAAEQQLGAYRSLRLPVDASGIVTTERGVQVVRIGNISQRGMQISHDGSLVTGQAVKVALQNGLERRGTVRWATQAVAGLSLLEPISFEHLARESEISSCAII